MVTEASEVTTVELARMLKMRGASDHRTVLFLGARTGGLFRSQELYKIAMQLGYPSFSELSRIDKFGACYKAIEQRRLGELDQDSIIAGCLRELDFTTADVCVAELVQEELFDVVISTNIDDFLERAFEHVHLRQPDDFLIRSPKRSLPPYSAPRTCTLIKAFGDRTARDYRMIGQDAYLDSDRDLKKDLEAYLGKDVLLIGFDPVWDVEIHDLFPLLGGSVWYVNEQLPPEHSRISRALRNRPGSSYVVGTPSPGSYNHFAQELHYCIMGRGPLSPELVQAMFNQINEIRDISLQLRRDIANLPVTLQELLRPKRKASTKKTRLE